MAGGVLVDARVTDRVPDGALDDGRVHVMAALAAGTGVSPAALLGEDPLPAPLPGGARVLALQGGRELHRAPAGGEVALVGELRAAELLAQGGRESPRQRRGAVLAALAGADDEFAAGEIEIEHAETQTFAETQACTVEEGRDEPADAVAAVQLTEHRTDLGPTEDDGQTHLRAGADQLAQVAHLPVQHVPVQEEQGAERLGLGGGADALGGREMREEGVDLGLRHLGRVAEPVMPDVAPHPAAVGLLGAAAVVARPQGARHLVDERGHGSSVALSAPPFKR